MSECLSQETNFPCLWCTLHVGATADPEKRRRHFSPWRNENDLHYVEFETKEKVVTRSAVNDTTRVASPHAEPPVSDTRPAPLYTRCNAIQLTYFKQSGRSGSSFPPELFPFRAA